MRKRIVNTKAYWKNILERVFDIIILLAQQNIALRGHRNENLDALCNNSIISTNHGYFFALFGLLSEYDTCLKTHLL